MLTRAIKYATECHSLQKRKFTGRPYIEHPLRVMAHVMLDRQYKNDTVAHVIAVCHDIVEDCAGSSNTERENISNEIGRLFHEEVQWGVHELTNEWTHERHPRMGRADRKRAEFNRLTHILHRSKIIKLYDRIANLTDMIENFGDARKFAHIYAQESWRLGTVLGDIENEYLSSEVLRLSAKLYQETR